MLIGLYGTVAWSFIGKDGAQTAWATGQRLHLTTSKAQSSLWNCWSKRSRNRSVTWTETSRCRKVTVRDEARKPSSSSPLTLRNWVSAWQEVAEFWATWEPCADCFSRSGDSTRLHRVEPVIVNWTAGLKVRSNRRYSQALSLRTPSCNIVFQALPFNPTFLTKINGSLFLVAPIWLQLTEKKIIFTSSFLYWQKNIFMISYKVQPKGVVDGKRPLTVAFYKI